MGDPINLFKKPKRKRLFKQRDSEFTSPVKEQFLELKDENAAHCNYGLGQESETSIAKIAQRAKGDKSTREGITFSTTARSCLRPTIDGIGGSRFPKAPKCDIVDRFTAQTLQRNENLDKHM